VGRLLAADLDGVPHEVLSEHGMRFDDVGDDASWLNK
jgi:hypothetical protein